MNSNKFKTFLDDLGLGAYLPHVFLFLVTIVLGICLLCGSVIRILPPLPTPRPTTTTTATPPSPNVPILNKSVATNTPVPTPAQTSPKARPTLNTGWPKWIGEIPFEVTQPMCYGGRDNVYIDESGVWQHGNGYVFINATYEDTGRTYNIVQDYFGSLKKGRCPVGYKPP